MTRVIVIGAGPAGMSAAVRAAELGASAVLVTSGQFGGMAATDGPVPVRTLAHAARLMRDAGQLSQYGIEVDEPTLDYSRLLGRVREIVDDVSAHSTRRQDFDALGVTVHENAGSARFADSHTVETESGLRLEAESIILCTGGVSRRLSIPGFELTHTHSDAWSLKSVPPSMLVVGGGDTGVQVASIFNAFGSRIQLLQAGPRILPNADEDVSTEVARAFRQSGIEIRENFGSIDSFEKTANGIRMNFTKDSVPGRAEAALAVMAVGWVANTSGMNLATVGVELSDRGFPKVDAFMRTTAGHIFAAGDVTGRLMLVPQALQEGFVAASNAVRGPTLTFPDVICPVGSFTDPEYAQVGLTEERARKNYDIHTAVIRFDCVARMIIDGRKDGLCKLITDRKTQRILGCHVVGERAVDIVQIAAIVVAAGMGLRDFLRIPISFPIYAGILTRAAAAAARELDGASDSGTLLRAS
jgi:pyruvate/2-oxoglutarate dehydrogenase complex dihydrolipoamide dehydrogenase (E3) component